MTTELSPPAARHGVAREARALTGLGLPLVGSAVAGFLIHMTDTILLGWYDVVSLAAATLATGYFFNVFILGAGFGNAVLPLVAEAMAAGDDTRARRATRMAFWLSAAFSLLTFPLFWWSEAIMLAIGQTPEVARASQDFLRIAMWGMFPALATNALRCYLSAQLLTGVQLWVTLAAVARACAAPPVAAVAPRLQPVGGAGAPYRGADWIARRGRDAGPP